MTQRCNGVLIGTNPFSSGSNRKPIRYRFDSSVEFMSIPVIEKTMRLDNFFGFIQYEWQLYFVSPSDDRYYVCNIEANSYTPGFVVKLKKPDCYF